MSPSEPDEAFVDMAASFCHCAAEEQIREAPKRCTCPLLTASSNALRIALYTYKWTYGSMQYRLRVCASHLQLVPCSCQPVPEAERALLPAAPPPPDHTTTARRRGEAGAQPGAHNAPACRPLPDV